MDSAIKKVLLIVLLGVFATLPADAARGRQPCSGAKGGIAYCTSDGRFMCHDGTLSQSKRICSGYGGAGSRQPETTRNALKAHKKKSTAVKTQQQPRVVENEQAVDTPQLRQPSCAPVYMASKPGFTHLPVCSGDQY
ncbi:hypothetical protein [Pantoea sp. C2G6]|uniref:hypothetical protein n=1 Tax=Pantoea sp. C2G6 TaxID=3243084 RepID=UPI003EDA266D